MSSIVGAVGIVLSGITLLLVSIQLEDAGVATYTALRDVQAGVWQKATDMLAGREAEFQLQPRVEPSPVCHEQRQASLGHLAAARVWHSRGLQEPRLRSLHLAVESDSTNAGAVYELAALIAESALSNERRDAYGRALQGWREAYGLLARMQALPLDTAARADAESHTAWAVWHIDGLVRVMHSRLLALRVRVLGWLVVLFGVGLAVYPLAQLARKKKATCTSTSSGTSASVGGSYTTVAKSDRHELLTLWQEAMQQTRQVHGDIWNGVTFFLTVNGLIVTAAATLVAQGNAETPWLLAAAALALMGFIMTLLAMAILTRHRKNYSEMVLRKTLIEDELGLHAEHQTGVEMKFPWSVPTDKIAELKQDPAKWVADHVFRKKSVGRWLRHVYSLVLAVHAVIFFGCLALAMLKRVHPI